MVSYISTEQENKNKSSEQRKCAISSVDRVPGYEPVGRRFESCMARHEPVRTKVFMGFLFFCNKAVHDRYLRMRMRSESHCNMRVRNRITNRYFRNHAVSDFCTLTF